MMKNTIKKFLLAAVFILIPIHSTFAIEVAITVDDLPAHGNLSPHLTRIDVCPNLTKKSLKNWRRKME